MGRSPRALCQLYEAEDLEQANEALGRFADLYATGQIPEYREGSVTFVEVAIASVAAVAVVGAIVVGTVVVCAGCKVEGVEDGASAVGGVWACWLSSEANNTHSAPTTRARPPVSSTVRLAEPQTAGSGICDRFRVETPQGLTLILHAFGGLVGSGGGGVG